MAYCYFDGNVIEEEKANLSIHTLGVQRGFGIFDLFRSRNGRPTFLHDHLERFQGSQKVLNLESLVSNKEIEQAVDDLQDKNQFSNATFKLMLLGAGAESDEQLSPLFYIINASLDVESLPKVGGLITHEYVREYPKIKSINYFTSNLLHSQKKAASAVDVLYHYGGMVSEASRSNVFIVKDGHIATPERNILHGVTRKHILKLVEEEYELQVRDITLKEVEDADEVFITSTLKEVMPILEIDEVQIRTGSVGPVTEKLQKRFQEYVGNRTQ